MKAKDIGLLRLKNQRIEGSSFKTAAEVVRHLGAMQAQDYRGTLWAIGLRLPGSTEVGIEKAIEDREILRTWPMRGTLHFVASEDARWMCELTAGRSIKAAAGRRRNLGLEDSEINKAETILTMALSGDNQLSRSDACALLEKNKIATTGQRGIHIMANLCQKAVLCISAHEGKQPTFALLAEWAPKAKNLDHDEALALLTTRYFTSHGPAQVSDFAWWSGLTMADVRKGIELTGSKLVKESIESKEYWLSATSPKVTTEEKVYLLPGFDEFILGYKDRSAVLHPTNAQAVCPGNNGMFMPTIIKNGQVVATWKKLVAKQIVSIRTQYFNQSLSIQSPKLQQTLQTYQAFTGLYTKLLS